MSSQEAVDSYTIFQIARRARRDKRTVRSYLAGNRVSDLARDSIESAMRELAIVVRPHAPPT